MVFFPTFSLFLLYFIKKFLQTQLIVCESKLFFQKYFEKLEKKEKERKEEIYP